MRLLILLDKTLLLMGGGQHGDIFGIRSNRFEKKWKQEFNKIKRALSKNYICLIGIVSAGGSREKLKIWNFLVRI